MYILFLLIVFFYNILFLHLKERRKTNRREEIFNCCFGAFLMKTSEGENEQGILYA